MPPHDPTHSLADPAPESESDQEAPEPRTLAELHSLVAKLNVAIDQHTEALEGR